MIPKDLQLEVCEKFFPSKVEGIQYLTVRHIEAALKVSNIGVSKATIAEYTSSSTVFWIKAIKNAKEKSPKDAFDTIVQGLHRCGYFTKTPIDYDFKQI